MLQQQRRRAVYRVGRSAARTAAIINCRRDGALTSLIFIISIGIRLQRGTAAALQLANFARARSPRNLASGRRINNSLGERSFGGEGWLLQNLSPARGYGDANVAATHAARIRAACKDARDALCVLFGLLKRVKLNLIITARSVERQISIACYPLCCTSRQHNTVKMPLFTLVLHVTSTISVQFFIFRKILLIDLLLIDY